MNRATDRKYGRRKSGAYGRPSQGDRQKRANKAVRKLHKELLLTRLLREHPTHIIVIDTFRCGHARAHNTWVDANGQSRCTACKNKRKKVK